VDVAFIPVVLVFRHAGRWLLQIWESKRHQGVKSKPYTQDILYYLPQEHDTQEESCG